MVIMVAEGAEEKKGGKNLTNQESRADYTALTFSLKMEKCLKVMFCWQRSDVMTQPKCPQLWRALIQASEDENNWFLPRPDGGSKEIKVNVSGVLWAWRVWLPVGGWSVTFFSLLQCERRERLHMKSLFWAQIIAVRQKLEYVVHSRNLFSWCNSIHPSIF